MPVATDARRDVSWCGAKGAYRLQGLLGGASGQRHPHLPDGVVPLACAARQSSSVAYALPWQAASPSPRRTQGVGGSFHLRPRRSRAATRYPPV